MIPGYSQKTRVGLTATRKKSIVRSCPGVFSVLLSSMAETRMIRAFVGCSGLVAETNVVGTSHLHLEVCSRASFPVCCPSDEANLRNKQVDLERRHRGAKIRPREMAQTIISKLARQARHRVDKCPCICKVMEGRGRTVTEERGGSVCLVFVSCLCCSAGSWRCSWRRPGIPLLRARR